MLRPESDSSPFPWDAATESIIPTLTIPKLLSDIQSRTVRNISYIGAAQLFVLVLTLFMVAVLTRLLTPEDFGIVSVGMIFMALFTAVQDFGIAPAVIQRDSRVEESISVGLALRWIIAGILMVMLVLVSPLLADFYGNEAIAPVLIVMSANLFIQPFAFASYVMLNRDLRFSCMAIGNMAQYAVTAVAAISLALAGFSYWSIVLGSLTGSVCYVAVLNHYGRVLRGPRIDMKLMKELMGFGSHLLITGLMAYVIFNIDQMVVGKVLGVVALGVYFVAVKFGRTLGEQISGTANRVLFPTMARMKDSIERLKVGYVQSLRMIAIVAVPLSVGMAALAPLFVPVVLGEGFEDAALPIAILSFQGLLNALIPPAANVLVAIGQPKYMSIQASVQAALMVVLVYPVALHFDIEGICYLTTLLSLGVFIYFLVVFSRIFKAGFVEISKPIAPALAGGLVTFVALSAGVTYLPETLLSLVAASLIGAALYLVCLHIASRGRDIRDFLGLLRGSFTRGPSGG